jgi:hypothetical protein
MLGCLKGRNVTALNGRNQREMPIFPKPREQVLA